MVLCAANPRLETSMFVNRLGTNYERTAYIKKQFNSSDT